MLFEDAYPELTDGLVARAMKVMDDGYLEQDYYRTLDAMVELEGGQAETVTYDTYSWTEHMSRKWGQWFRSAADLLEQLRLCGFDLGNEQRDDSIERFEKRTLKKVDHEHPHRE